MIGTLYGVWGDVLRLPQETTAATVRGKLIETFMSYFTRKRAAKHSIRKKNGHTIMDPHLWPYLQTLKSKKLTTISGT